MAENNRGVGFRSPERTSRAAICATAWADPSQAESGCIGGLARVSRSVLPLRSFQAPGRRASTSQRAGQYRWKHFGGAAGPRPKCRHVAAAKVIVGKAPAWQIRVIHLKGARSCFSAWSNSLLPHIAAPARCSPGRCSGQGAAKSPAVAGMLAIELGETHVVFPAIGHRRMAERMDSSVSILNK